MDLQKQVHFYFRVKMDFISLDSYPHYAESEKIVSALGFHLVELKISPQNGVTKIEATITSADPAKNIGVNDCSKVHKVLLEALEEILGTDNTYMELSSPGMERNIRNAAEFAFFIGREIRVYDKNTTDWIGGKLVSAGEKSLVLETAQEDGSSEKMTVLFDDIAKAKFVHL